MDGSFRDMGIHGNHSTEHGADSEFSSIPYISLDGSKRKWSMMGGVSSLSLGLGCPSDSEGSVTAACTAISLAREDGESLGKVDCDLHLGNEKLLDSKTCTGLNSGELKQLQDVNLGLSLFTGPSESGITSIHQSISSLQTCGAQSQSADEESTSRYRRLASLQTLRGNSLFFKTCLIEGCGKRARGASRQCISHGGVPRCQKPECQKGAECGTAYCKAHGGGQRCESLGSSSVMLNVCEPLVS